MMLTRRRVVASAAAATLGLVLARKSSRAATSSFERPLPIPALIDARATGNAVVLTAAQGQHAFWHDAPSPTYGYSSPVLGPAIRVYRGDRVEFTVENRINYLTTAHWHGLLVPGDCDGGPYQTIDPGKSWRPVFTIDQPETTAWFHPHPHGDTARQVYYGLAGLLLIEDGTGARVGLPRTYGVDDLPLILQDRWFYPNGTLGYAANPMTVMEGFRGNTVTVNAAVAPVARVPASIVRLRVLNASNARNLDLDFSDGRTFQIIASDGGYLTAPIQAARLMISPGERFELLVDFSDGQNVELRTGPDRYIPMMGMMMGNNGGSYGPIMRFEPDKTRKTAVTSFLNRLTPLSPADSSQAIRRRHFTLNDSMMGMMGGMGMGGMGMRGMGMGRMGSGETMGINGRPFDMERVDVETKIGTSEIWEISSQTMAHPFHIHGAHFRVLSVAGEKPPIHLQGWKDTVLVPRTAEILVRFTQPATGKTPFMFHCHILEHEDAGMMGQYTCG